MTNKLRDLLASTRALESRLTAAVEQAAATVVAPAAVTALEIVQHAVDDIALQVHPAGRGRYAFPFNTIAVTFAAPTPEHHARLDAICVGPPTLHDRVVRRLASAGVIAADVDVSVGFAETPDASWTRAEFHIALARVDPAARPSRDSALRVNHVAFADNGDAVNSSVSRRHARIELDTETRRPRLIDDNSAQGTSVIRLGKGIPVPRGSRGLVLQSGDELVLGQARMRVRISSFNA